MNDCESSDSIQTDPVWGTEVTPESLFRATYKAAQVCPLHLDWTNGAQQ